MPDHLNPAQRSELMSRIKGRNTGPELCVRQLLHRLGYRFRLHGKNFPGTPDIIFTRRKKVVFVHGCFWHGHTCKKSPYELNSSFWREKILTNMERDRKNYIEIAEKGWQYIVIWECDLKSNRLNEVEQRLVNFLGPHRFDKVKTP